MPSFTTAQLATRLGARLDGPPDTAIHGLEQPDRAAPGQIVFLREARFVEAWSASRGSAALVPEALPLPADGRALLRVPDADLALITLLELFAPPQLRPAIGCHPSAVVHPSARLGEGAAIGPGCFLGTNVTIGPRAVLHPRVTVLDDCRIGADTVLYPGVVIRERCIVGDRTLIHPNAVIGADGFGYRPAPDGRGLVKVPQIGTVVIGNDVEIGAGTCIDRGTFTATTIGDGTKIDNLCQIAHNCRIGRACVFAAQVGLAGSVIVGDGVMFGGKVGVKDNTTIGAGARVGACSAVAGDIPAGETWLGVPAQPARALWRELAALRKLPQFMKKERGA